MPLTYQITNLILRPAPKPAIPFQQMKLSPEAATYLGNIKDWTRECEAAVRSMENAIKELQSLNGGNTV